MELKDLKREIAELVQGMTALLDSNTRIGQELADAKEDLKKAHKDLSSAKDDLSKAKMKIDILQSEINYLKGKQNACNRHRFGKKARRTQVALQSRRAEPRMRMRTSSSTELYTKWKRPGN